MSTHASALPCPHEIRPGTTVCLHCAAAVRRAARAHARRTIGRVAAGMGALAAVTLVAAGARGAVQQLKAVGPGSPARIATSEAVTSEAATSETATAATTERSVPVDETPLTGASPAPVAPGSPAVAPASARLWPRIAEGRTALGRGVVAERRGDTVRVLFDTPHMRTRHPEKFEGTVRATLPALYGAAATSALAGVPHGALVASADLAGAAPRGVRVVLPDGQMLALRPETRPGRDGPLVVRYAITLDAPGARR